MTATNKTTSEEFLQEMLKSHNDYRDTHQAPPLALDNDLCKGAQQWATFIAGKDKLQHDTDGADSQGFGENVAMKYNSSHTDFKGHEFTDYWYAEIENYTFNVENQIECGHFTQVVWKGTEKCGFGRAVSESGKVYVVGRYKPAGNYTDEFCKHVLPPKDGKIKVPNTSQASSSGKPIIGPKHPKDILLGTKISTTTKGSKKTQHVEETYQTPKGDKYTVSLDRDAP